MKVVFFLQFLLRAFRFLFLFGIFAFGVLVVLFLADRYLFSSLATLPAFRNSFLFQKQITIVKQVTPQKEERTLSSAATPPDVSDLLSRVMRIAIPSSSEEATGILLSNDGLVGVPLVTLPRNQKKQAHFFLKDGEGKVREASMVFYDPFSHIAFLRAQEKEETTFPFLSFESEGNLVPGKEVFLLALAPEKGGFFLRKGTVEGFRPFQGIQDDTRLSLQEKTGFWTLFSSPQEKGAPVSYLVLDESGKAYGLAVASLRQEGKYILLSRQDFEASQKLFLQGEKRVSLPPLLYKVLAWPEALEVGAQEGAVMILQQEDRILQKRMYAQGIRPNDVVVALDGKPLSPSQTFSSLLHEALEKEKKSISFTILRYNTKITRDVSLVWPEK